MAKIPPKKKINKANFRKKKKIFFPNLVFFGEKEHYF